MVTVADDSPAKVTNRPKAFARQQQGGDDQLDDGAQRDEDGPDALAHGNLRRRRGDSLKNVLTTKHTKDTKEGRRTSSETQKARLLKGSEWPTFIVKGKPRKGLVDDKLITLDGLWKVTDTKKHKGKTYYVVEPVKKDKKKEK